MDASGSMLLTVIERIRAIHDEPDVVQKYDRDFMIRHLIMPSYVEVVSRVNMNAENPVVVRMPITLAADQEYYQLPPSIQEVLRIATIDSVTGNTTADVLPRPLMSPYDVGWTLEGNMLVIRPWPKATETIDLWYVPSGDVGLHYNPAPGTPGAGIQIGPDGSTFTLPGTIQYGVLDRRPNAYVGCVLRLLSNDPDAVWQERVIDSYDPATRQGTVRVPFDPDMIGSYDFAYEIAPPYSQALWEAVAIRAAMKLCLIRRVKGDVYMMLTQEYAAAIKTVRDNLSCLNSRISKTFKRDTIDHPGRNDILFGYIQ